MKTKNLSIALLGILVLSCSKYASDIPGKQSIAGNWRWTKTDGGIANNIHDTPASTGNSIYLQFTGDNQYFFYTNGALASKGTYTIEIRNCIHDNTAKKLIHFSSPEDRDLMIEKLDNFTLELSDEAYDGITSTYAKK